jgi:mannosylglycerate hydrolase
LSKSLQHERTEAPRHYPDNDLVQVSEVAAWVPEVPAYGVRAFPHQTRARKHAVPNPAWSEAGTISNGLVKVRIEEGGSIAVTDLGSGRTLTGVVVWDSQTDLGDLYTQSLRGPRFDARFRGSRITGKGPVRASMETRWQLGGAGERIDVTVTLIVDANAPFVRVQVRGTNAASDHRLRLGFRTDVDAPRVLADAMFGPVDRPEIVVSPADAAFERPPATAPLHRYVSLFNASRGATLISDGLGEYEVTPDGTAFVTLVRSVSELSRNDMPERPGHAGWPTHTPEAQCHGPFAADLALLLHEGDSAEARDFVERIVDDVLLPLTGRSLRSALELPDVVEGVALHGVGLACSTVKESENHDWLVLRCVNVTEAQQDGAWSLGVAVSEARLGRLDETPLTSLPISGNRISFKAPPRAVVTILVR